MSDHDHPLPPPEVDRLNIPSIFAWGFICFGLVIFTVFALTGYFWGEREGIYGAKVEQPQAYHSLRSAEQSRVADRLAGTKPLWGIQRGARLEATFNSEGAAKAALIDRDADAVNERRLVQPGRYQIPIEAAMQRVAANRAAPLPPGPELEVVGGAPAAAAAPTPPPPFEVDAALAAQGQALFTQRICNTCHSIDGSRLIGPTMKGIWGRAERLADGRDIFVNEAYFRRSIKAPMDDVVEGYPPAMPQMEIPDEEITALLHYVASLN